jgi:hypothetical protein
MREPVIVAGVSAPDSEMATRLLPSSNASILEP